MVRFVAVITGSAFGPLVESTLPLLVYVLFAKTMVSSRLFRLSEFAWLMAAISPTISPAPTLIGFGFAVSSMRSSRDSSVGTIRRCWRECLTWEERELRATNRRREASHISRVL